MFGATAGNLGTWSRPSATISTGLQVIGRLALPSGDAAVQYVPRFVRNTIRTLPRRRARRLHLLPRRRVDVPEPRLFDRGRPLADFDATNGLVYFATPTTATRKSLRPTPKSAPPTERATLTRTPTPVCNPDATEPIPTRPGTCGSPGRERASSTSWAERPNDGRASPPSARPSVRPRSSTRTSPPGVIREICPTGTFSQADIDRSRHPHGRRSTSGSSSPRSPPTRPAPDSRRRPERERERSRRRTEAS